MPPTETDLLELLYAALHSEFGTAVATEDPEFLRQKLYPLRKANPELHCLSLHPSPLRPTQELWIRKNADGPHD